MKIPKLFLTNFLLLFLISSFSATLYATEECQVTGPNTACEEGVSLYTYPYNPNHIFNWTVNGGNGVISVNSGTNQSEFLVTWGPSGAGPYQVILTVTSNPGGIICNTTVNVTLTPAPEPQISSDFNSDCIPPKDRKGPADDEDPLSPCHTVCEGRAVTYSTPLNGSNTYQWIVNGNYTNINTSTGGGQAMATITWGSPGKAYVIVKETSSDGCIGTDTICVEIVDSPVSSFTVNQGINNYNSVPWNQAPPNITICKNGTVCFNDNSTGAAFWNWDFGDGSTSTLQNDCHTFTSSGSYNVMLVAENECHCLDTSYVVVEVTEETGPEIVCKNVLCDNGTFTYNAIIPAPCAGADYYWTVSNNGIITGASGTINNQTPQTVDGQNILSIDINWLSGPIGSISLQILNCPGVCDQITSIDIPIIPSELDITGDDVVCPDETGYYNVTCFPGTEYTWKIDGNVVPGENTNELWHTFPGTGTYDVTVEYNNSFLSCSGASNTFTVKVLEKFEVSGPITVCQNASAQYSISTLGSVVSLSWQLKNNLGAVVGSGTGTTFSPSTATPGNYTVVANDLGAPDYCNDNAVLGIEIIPSPPPPTTINGPVEVCLGQAYVYSAVPSSADYYLKWEFIEGSTSTYNGNSVSYTWTTTGTVKLYHVSKLNDCESTALTININDKTTPTSVDISNSISGPTTACSNTDPANPEVYGTTYANFDGYIWSINPPTAGSIVDGQNTNSIKVLWNNNTTSSTADIELVPVVCSDTGGVSGTTVGTYTVTFVAPPPLTITPNSPVCAGVIESWTASISGGGSNYNWEIQQVPGGAVVASGSGATANHNFTNGGSYVIIMNGTSSSCNGVSTASENITVNSKPVANLSFTGNINCIKFNTVNFTLSVQGIGPYTYEWFRSSTSLGNLGTSHSIGPNPADAGTYYVVVTDANGCTSISNKIRVHECIGQPQPCNSTGAVVDFTTTPFFQSPSPGCGYVEFASSVSGGPTPTSHEWTFANLGSGSGTSSQFTFPASGIYPVTLIVYFNSGDCPETITKNVIVPVISNFEMNITCVSNVFEVNFVNTSDVYAGNIALDWGHRWWVRNVNSGLIVANSNNMNFNNVPNLLPGEEYEVRLRVRD